MMKTIGLLACLFAVTHGGIAHAQDSALRTPDVAIAALDVHPELEVQLFAAEPMMFSPSNIDIDHKGRVWVCEVVNYRAFRNKHDFREEGDRILVLEDTDGDGAADKSTVFYQGSDIDSAHGVCVLGDKVIVSANDSVFIFTDSDGDLKADKKELLFTGIAGAQHDHGIHAFIFGPDGKLYFNFGNAGKHLKDKHGNPVIDKAGNAVTDERKPYQEGMIFRCNLDGSEVETLAWNFRNNWELAVDSFGTMWQSDNDDDGNFGVRINYVMEFGNYGYKDEFTGAAWKEDRSNIEKEIPRRHWHLNDPGVVPNLLQTGAGSPTGIIVYEGDLLPEIFRNQMIHCDAGPNIVRAYPVKKDGAGYKAEVVNILEGTRDKWFRPSDVCVAPDGSLIVADWYDPGVGGHAMGDPKRGRLFRVVPKGHKGYKVPEHDFSTALGAAKALTSPNLEARYLAYTALTKMGEAGMQGIRGLWLSDNPRHRARAAWVIAGIPDLRLTGVRMAMEHGDPDMRILALRLAWMSDTLDPAELVHSMVNDSSPQVRRQCALALRHSKSSIAPGLWADLAVQHDGKDRWYLEALGIGADRNWDAFFRAWLDRVGDDWNTPGGRDIIWRARTKLALPYLVKLVKSDAIPDDEKPRYMRAFDFHSGKAKEEALESLLDL